MKRLFYALGLISFLTFQTNAAEPTVDWVKEYGNKGGDGYTITQTSDDGYIISGMSDISGNFGFSVTKLDKNANLEWQKKFGIGFGWAAIQSKDNNYVTAGVLVDESSAVVKKLDKSGNTIWTYKLNNGILELIDHYIDVIETLDGNYIISSFGYYKNSRSLYVLKLSNSGSEIWNKKIEYSTKIAVASSIVETSEGGYAITGGTGSYYAENVIFVKLDKDGNVIKNITLPKNTTGQDYGIRLIKTLDNGYAIIGNKRIIKLNNNTDIEWEQPIGGYSVIQLNDGSFVIATGNDNLIRLSKDGKTQIWNKTNITGFSHVFGVSKDKCNGFIITGIGFNSKIGVAHLTDPDIATCCTAPADMNGSTQEGINLVKATPSNYGLFTQTQIDAATQTGIDLVKAKPNDYNLFTQTQIDAAKQTGIDLVKTKPNDYNLFSATDVLNKETIAKQTGVQEGITQGINKCKTDPVSCGIIVSTDQCKTNPASCNLFTQTQIDAAIQTGINQCKTKPADCGITIKSVGGFSQEELNTAKAASLQEGITKCKLDPASCEIVISNDQCKTNPASCNLFTQEQVNAEKETAKQNGIYLCKNDPNCKGVRATYNPLNGEVHIPFIDVPNGLGFVQTFDVYLIQRSGSFIFDLDTTRVSLVH